MCDRAHEASDTTPAPLFPTAPAKCALLHTDARPPKKPTAVQPVETSEDFRRLEARLDALPDPRPAFAGRPATAKASAIATDHYHASWAARRARVRKALYDTGASPARLWSFDNCGSTPLVWVEQNGGGVRCTACYCHDRFCGRCGEARRRQISHALRPLVKKSRTLHVVLTPVSVDKPLALQLKKLYADASKLRSSKWWKLRVAGGSQTLELTRNQQTGLWHPHLHLLVQADWLQLQELSAAWLKATGDSWRVHVSLVLDGPSAVREVTKYLGKIVHRSIEHSPSAMREMVCALKGKRLVNTFGSWRGTELTPKPEPVDGEIWQVWGSLEDLYALAARGDTWAKCTLQILVAQHRGHPTSHVGSTDPEG